MARLEWQPVNTPNFGGSLEGLRLFGNMIGNATDGLGNALGNFQKAQQVDAQQRAMTAAQGFTDPNSYRTALANGQITQGIDPSLLTPAALESLQGRTGKLTNDAVDLQNLQKDQYTFGRTQTADTALDAARPSVAAMIQKATGVPLAPEVAALPTRELMALARSSQDFDTSALRNKATRTEMDLAEQQRDAQRAADTAVQTDFPSILSSDAARKYLVNSALPVEAKKLVQSRLESQFGPLFGPVIGTPATSTTTSSGSAAAPALLNAAASTSGPVPAGGGYDTVVGNLKTAKPVTQMSIGEVINTGKNEWIPATRGNAALGLPADKGSSAAGRYQITGETLQEFGKKVYGDGFESQPFTPEVQDKIAEAIFNVRKGGDLSSTWVGLKTIPGSSTPGAFKDKSWAEVRDVIARTETGGSPAAALTAAAQPAPTQRSLGAATDALGLAAIENAGGNFYVNRLAQAAKSNASRGEVLSSLMSGDFKGANERVVNDAIARVMREAKVPASVAGEMVKESMNVSRLNGALPSWLGGGGRNINEDALDQQIKQWSAAGGPRDVLARGRDISLTGQELSAATTAFDTAKANLTAARNRAESVPAVAAQLPALEAEVAKKQAAVMLAQQAIQTQGMQGSVDRPNAPTPSEPIQVSAIDQQIIAANERASRLPLASQERAAVLNEIRQLQMQRAAESPPVRNIF